MVSVVSTFALIALGWVLAWIWTWSSLRWRGWLATGKRQYKRARGFRWHDLTSWARKPFTRRRMKQKIGLESDEREDSGLLG